jgi:casein kinase II subunit beta
VSIVNSYLVSHELRSPRFCGLKGHEMFCEVERSYIEDGFNLYGLRVCVSNFSDCLDLILDRIGPDEDSDDSHLTQSACTLYGLIHARYIITAHGLDAMYNKVRFFPL